MNGLIFGHIEDIVIDVGISTPGVVLGRYASGALEPSLARASSILAATASPSSIPSDFAAPSGIPARYAASAARASPAVLSSIVRGASPRPSPLLPPSMSWDQRATAPHRPVATVDRVDGIEHRGVDHRHHSLAVCGEVPPRLAIGVTATRAFSSQSVITFAWAGVECATTRQVQTIRSENRPAHCPGSQRGPTTSVGSLTASGLTVRHLRGDGVDHRAHAAIASAGKRPLHAGSLTVSSSGATFRRSKSCRRSRSSGPIGFRPMLCRTLRGSGGQACSSCRGNFPAPTISRSMTNLGIALSLGCLRALRCVPRHERCGAKTAVLRRMSGSAVTGRRRRGQMSRVSR